MTIGASVFLLAIGLILAIAVDIAPTPAAGINIEWNTIGWILVLAGLLGLLLSFMSARRRATVYTDQPGVVPPARTTTIVEDDRYPPLQ